jgi:hypothetical protein
MNVPDFSDVISGSSWDEHARPLTRYEIAAFLLRHPIIAGMIAETEGVMGAGLYDYDYNPYSQWKLPGVIPPWGLQEYDREYGSVVIFPARDGTWRYSGFTGAGDSINLPAYSSPSGIDPLGDLAGVVKTLAFAGVALAVLYGLNTLKRKG